jgi:hypothetical protein
MVFEVGDKVKLINKDSYVEYLEKCGPNESTEMALAHDYLIVDEGAPSFDSVKLYAPDKSDYWFYPIYDFELYEEDVQFKVGDIVKLKNHVKPYTKSSSPLIMLDEMYKQVADMAFAIDKIDIKGHLYFEGNDFIYSEEWFELVERFDSNSEIEALKKEIDALKEEIKEMEEVIAAYQEDLVEARSIKELVMKPISVDDYVVVNEGNYNGIAKVERIEDNKAYGVWYEYDSRFFSGLGFNHIGSGMRHATEEEIKEYELSLKFDEVGRDLFSVKPGDIVYIPTLGEYFEVDTDSLSSYTKEQFTRGLLVFIATAEEASRFKVV